MVCSTESPMSMALRLEEVDLLWLRALSFPAASCAFVSPHTLDMNESNNVKNVSVTNKA